MGSRAIKGRRGTKTSNKKTGVLMALSILVAVVVAGVVGVYGLCSAWVEDLPDYANADAYNTAKPTVVYAADGTTILAEFQLENRQPVTLDEVSELVRKGTVATEDERFYGHNGVDILGIGRALVNNLAGGQLEGASTITQQFVRNTILADEMNDISLKRKVREAYISLKLEEQYDKDEILLMYLNTINYGAGAYGIQAAAQRYFSKDASDLTLNEAATLIGIQQSPTYNDPTRNMENAVKRRNTVLDRMVSNDVITAEEAEAVKQEPITLNENVPSQTGILAYPYFTSYVRNQLTDPNGKYAYSTAEVFKGGLTVYTTLDVTLQGYAEEACEKKRKQAGGDPFEVALVAIDPDNGYIKAMVSQGEYGSGEGQTMVNMATGEGGSGRQAGSSFKTFTLAAAIEAGIDPETKIDAGRQEKFPGWDVHNIGYADYGTRSIASAFAVSSNTAFARLCLSLGPDKVADMAHKLGIESPLEEVGSITLGTSLVTPLEMADAYATLANGGIHYDPECIERIVDRNGKVIVDNANPQGERVIDQEVAVATVEVMKGVVTSGTGRAAALWSLGQEAAGKTGTADDYKDNWFCGITPQLSVAIWLGDRADITKAKSIPGGVSAASVFSDFLTKALAGQQTEKFPTADKKPTYIKDFQDEKYHIGGNYGKGEEDAEERGEAAQEGTAPDAPTTTTPDPGTGGTTGGETGGNTGGSTGGSTGGTTGGTTGGNTGGSTGGNTGGSTGGTTGGNTGGNTGGSTGGSTGGNTGGSTGGNTGGNTGGSTGGTTGGNTGGSTGGGTPAAQPAA